MGQFFDLRGPPTCIVSEVRGLFVLAALSACGRLDFETTRVTTDGAIDSPDVDSSVTIDGWSRIAAGSETTCGIYKSRAYCWGSGTNNEIGDGAGVNRPSPTAVALPAGTVSQITEGEGHGCAIVGGAAYCWGNGAIGNGQPTSALPVAVSLPATITSISAGGGFACAVSSGSVYCWGQDPAGALGNGAGGASNTPQLVTLPSAALSVDAGNDHVMALLADGSLYVWGHNDAGCYGTGSTSPTSSDVPVATAAVTGVQPSLAGWHACAVKSGAATCWGMGSIGELGDGLSQDSASPVTPMGMGSGVTAMVTGGGPTNRDASCAIVAGKVSCWGSGTLGRLGTGNEANQATPQAVQNLPNDAVDLALGFEHSCALASDGTLRCWGSGALGQLGDGNSANSLTPVVVPLPP
jgi:alpha-tubulin suppressor-like RCC1 family protein